MDAMVPYIAMNFFDCVISKLGAPPNFDEEVGDSRIHSFDQVFFVIVIYVCVTLPRGFTRLPVHKIIIWTQADIRFTKFRPSTVAASAILCASEKLFPDDPNDFASVILSRYAHFDSTIKDELAECVGMIRTTYQNKMNSLVIAKGLVNYGVGTSQPLTLAPDEASTVPSGSGKEIIEEGSKRHRKKTVAEEASESVTGIQTLPEQSSSRVMLNSRNL